MMINTFCLSWGRDAANVTAPAQDNSNTVMTSSSVKFSSTNSEMNEMSMKSCKSRASTQKKNLRLSGNSGKSGKWKQGETVLQSCAGGRLTGYEGHAGQISWWGSRKHPKICSWSDPHNHVGLRISNWEAESDMRAPSLLQASWFLARGTKVHAFSADIFVRFVFFFAWDALGKPHLLILCVLAWRFFNGTCREAKMNLKKIQGSDGIVTGDSRCWGIQALVVTS